MTLTSLTPPIAASDEPSSPTPEQLEPAGWAARLLGGDAQESGTSLLRQLGAGLGLSALYGLAIGARQGGPALVEHALGVPLGLSLVLLLGGPSLFIFLSLCRAPIDVHAAARTAARAIARAGLLLAGLAPAAALFVVSSETPDAAAGAVALGLVLSGGSALFVMTADVLRSACSARFESAVGGAIVSFGFALFAVALALRAWTGLLPILGGGS